MQVGLVVVEVVRVVSVLDYLIPLFSPSVPVSYGEESPEQLPRIIGVAALSDALDTSPEPRCKPKHSSHKNQSYPPVPEGKDS